MRTRRRDPRRDREEGQAKPSVELKGQGQLTIILDEQDLRALAGALEPYITLIQDLGDEDEPTIPPTR